MSISWICKPFYALTPAELYAIIQLRNEVFVVEQACIFQDADNHDQAAWHLMGWKNQRLAAYTRLLPSGITYQEASIGRVVSSPEFRGLGYGIALMQKSIEKIYELWGRQPIRIGAQEYLLKFYKQFGFNAEGDTYMEDGIPHRKMLLS